MLCGGGGAVVLEFLEILEVCSFGSWKCRTCCLESTYGELV